MTNETKQTAVEWLENKIDYLIPFVSDEHANYFNSLIKQAKEMEKEQIIEANWEASEDTERANNYYEQTYGDIK